MKSTLHLRSKIKVLFPRHGFTLQQGDSHVEAETFAKLPKHVHDYCERLHKAGLLEVIGGDAPRASLASPEPVGAEPDEPVETTGYLAEVPPPPYVETEDALASEDVAAADEESTEPEPRRGKGRRKG